MTLIVSNVTALTFSAYITSANTAFGTEGGEALRLLLDSVRLVLAARPPELITPPLTIVAPVGQLTAEVVAGAHGNAVALVEAEAVADYMSQRATDMCLIAIAADRTFRVVTPSMSVNHASLAASAVVYAAAD